MPRAREIKILEPRQDSTRWPPKSLYSVSNGETLSAKLIFNLVPRGRDPFGQRRGLGPLARWDFESGNRGLPVTLRGIKSKTQDGGEKWCRYISGRREIWIRKSWKSKYYPQTERRRDPENNRFDAKRCFSRSPNWLRKIFNISNNATLDGLYGF